MAVTPTIYRGFKVTKGDATGEQLAILLPTAYRVLHLASSADADTDWNVANPTHPTFYVHSETTPATDYVSVSHDGTTGLVSSVGGTLSLNGVTTVNLQVGGTVSARVTDAGITAPDDYTFALGGVGGGDAKLSWSTYDANANSLQLELPTGDSTNVPVLVIGQGTSGADLGLHNGIVDPKIALLAAGAVTTGPTLEFRKARGTVGSPTVVTSADDIGRIMAYGCVAAGEYVLGASIDFDMVGTIATTRGPSTITFKTATDAAPSVLTTALTISAAQVVTMASGVSTGDFKLNLTLTAGADGVGANGEQLTSGGAAAETSWTAAACQREVKTDIALREDAETALERLVATPIYDFRYDPEKRKGTGDYDTRYTGFMADEAPWAMHYDGTILNPISTFGHTVLAFKALTSKLDQALARIAQLEAV